MPTSCGEYYLCTVLARRGPMAAGARAESRATLVLYACLRGSMVGWGAWALVPVRSGLRRRHGCRLGLSRPCSRDTVTRVRLCVECARCVAVGSGQCKAWPGRCSTFSVSLFLHILAALGKHLILNRETESRVGGCPPRGRGQSESRLKCQVKRPGRRSLARPRRMKPYPALPTGEETSAFVVS